MSCLPATASKSHDHRAFGRSRSMHRPFPGITIDGDLSDWPAAMPRHAITNLHAFPTVTGPGRRENAFLFDRC